MIESFVDLTYRGLPLGRRVKLAQVRPSNGYLELPTPMPVGTTISIVSDEGVVIDAVVLAIHEQVGGSDRMPGMQVAPRLAGPAAEWWTARVALPEEAPKPKPVKPIVKATPAAAPKPRVTQPFETPPVTPAARDDLGDADLMAAAAAMAAIPVSEPTATRSRPVTVRPRSQTLVDRGRESVEAAPDIRISEEHSIPELVDDGKKTTVMDSIDPAMLEQLLRSSSDGLPVAEAPVHPTAVDDKPTVIMAALDPAALGLEVGRTGEMAAVVVEDEPDGGDGGESKPTGSGAVRRRRAQKRR